MDENRETEEKIENNFNSDEKEGVFSYKLDSELDSPSSIYSGIANIFDLKGDSGMDELSVGSSDIYDEKSDAIDNLNQQYDLIGPSNQEFAKYRQEGTMDSSNGSLDELTPSSSPSDELGVKYLISEISRWLWPLVVLASALVRYDLMSLVYWLSFVLWGCFQSNSTMISNLRIWIIVVPTVVSSVCLTAKTIFHIYLLAQSGSYSDFPVNETIANLFGFFKISDVLGVLQQFIPEILMSLVGYVRVYFNQYIVSVSLLDENILDQRVRKNIRIFTGALSLTFLLCVYLASICIPNVLSLIYLVYFIFELTHWVIPQKSPTLCSYIRLLIFLYLLAHTTVIYVFQIQVVHSNFPPKISEILGLFVYFRGSTDIQQYVYGVSLLGMLFTSTVRQALCRRYRILDGGFPSFANDLGIHHLIPKTSTRGISHMLSKFVYRNHAELIGWIFLGIAISFPSYITLPLLLWACFILISNKYSEKTILPLVIYLGLIIAVQALFNLNGFSFKTFNDIGLVKFNFVYLSLGVQTILFTMICVIIPKLSFSTIFQIDGAQNFEISEDISSVKSNESSREEIFSPVRSFVIISWTYFSRFVLEYAYLISLVVLFLCGLQEVNVLNAGFLIYFIAFLIFPRLARFSWASLVIYTELVILLEFMWQFSFARNANLDRSSLWGLKPGNLWPILTYHLIILLFTSVQLRVYRLLNIEENNRQYYDAESNGINETIPNEAVLKFERMKPVKFMRDVYNFLFSLVVNFNLVFCYLSFGLIGIIGENSIINVTYLIILLLCISFHQFDAPEIVRMSWLPICLYPAIIAISSYLFQFEDLQALLFQYLSPSWWKIIGFQSESGLQLFEYLFQHIISLLLCVFQYRIFLNHIQCISIEAASSKLFHEIFPFMFEAFKRFMVVHWSKVAIFFTFLTAAFDISAVGFVTLIYLVLFMPFPDNYQKTRWILLLWIEFTFIIKMFVNLLVSKPSALLIWIGFPGNESAYGVMVGLIVILAIHIASDRWKSQFLQQYPDFSPTIAEWPLLPFPTEANEDENSRSFTLRRIASAARMSLHEMEIGLNYWLSNFFKNFGFEIICLVTLVVSYARSDAIGFLYLLFLGSWLAFPKSMAKYWSIYMSAIGILMLFQYLSALSYPPNLGLKLPWANLPPSTLSAIGLPVNGSGSKLISDFFLLIFSSFQFVSLMSTRTNIPIYHLWRLFERRFHRDFTKKPRSKIDQLAFIFVRYFVWIPVLLLFAVGTSYVNITCFVFLVFSLYYISVGENVLVKKETRKLFWKIVLVYSYMWFLIQIGYQIPAYILNLDNLSQEDGWSSVWRPLIGLSKMSLEPSKNHGTSPVFAAENVIAMLMFFAVVIQRRINHSHALHFVLRYIRKDANLSAARADYYLERRKAKNLEKKQSYEREIADLRKKVSNSKTDIDEVSDWISVFGERTNDCGYQIVDKVKGSEDVFDVISVDMDDYLDGFKERKNNAQFPAAEASTLSPFSDQELLDSHKKSDDPRTGNEYLEETHFPKKISISARFMDFIIEKLLLVASEYTDLYISYGKHLSSQSKNDSRLWSFFRALFYAISAQTTILVYIAVYANQIYHGNVLSIIPTFGVLLVGLIQRPFPSRSFWNFFFVVIESTILIKYLFQFDVWEFNRLECPPSDFGNWVQIIGIQKACGNFFTEVSTELVVLIGCIVHRGLMKRLGLWKANIQEYDEAEDYRSEPHNVPSSPKSKANEGKTPLQLPKEKISPEFAETDVKNKPNTLFWSFANWVEQKYKKFTDISFLSGEDYYVNYFIFDFLVFIFTIFFWTSFSGDTSDDSNIEFLSTVFNQNQVPPLFVAILVTNFILIIADRAIYVSKSLFGKLVLQYITVFGFCIWIFFVLPPSNNKPVSTLSSLQLWFFIKCVYWYFSGQQIKTGFPRVRVHNFFMRKFSRLNNIAFLLFRSIPFVWEFRSLTDWTLCDTSLDLYNWLKFEDIMANLYVVQNTRIIQHNIPRKFGEPQNRVFKTSVGSLMVLGLVALIWFPLILLSVPGSTMPNPASNVAFSISIAGTHPLYSQIIPARDIKNFTEYELSEIRKSKDYSFLFPSYLSLGVMQQVRLPINSMSNWNINPPAQEKLLKDLRNTEKNIFITSSYEFLKESSALTNIARGEHSQLLSNSTRFELAEAIEISRTSSNFTVNIENVYPFFLRALPSGNVINLAPTRRPLLMNATLNLRSIQDENSTSAQVWWELDQNSAESTKFFVFSDNIPSFSTISSYGIIGLYVAVVFAVGRFMRIIITGLTLRIIYEDLPNPAPILKLCSETILAREFRDFDTEETLYWQLITLFRSPDALFRKTRMPENSST